MEKEKMRLLFYLKKSTQNKNGSSEILCDDLIVEREKS